MKPQPKKYPWGRPASSDPGAPAGRAHRAQPRSVYPKPRGSSSGQRGIPCRIPGPTGERTVGYIIDGPYGPELVKRVRESKHRLRVADAWGVDLQLVERARDEGVCRIRLDEEERGISYLSTPRFLLEHGFQQDFGHGRQVFLPRSQWAQIDGAQLQLLPG